MASEFKYFRVEVPNTVDTAGIGEGFIDSRKVTEFNSLPTQAAATQFEIVNGGSSYVATNPLTVQGGTSSTATVITVDAVDGGVITQASITTPGDYTVLPANPVSVTGGAGTGATFNLIFEDIGFKEKANARWEEILKALQETGAFGVSDITYTGGTESSAPTQIDFTVSYRSEQVVFIHDLINDATGNTVYGPSTNLDIVGSQLTYVNATEEAVVERAVATALSRGTYRDSRELVVTVPTAGGSDPDVVRFSNRFLPVQVTQFGGSGNAATRLSNVEGAAGFTVTQLSV